MVTSVMPRGWSLSMLFLLPAPAPPALCPLICVVTSSKNSPFKEEGKRTGSWDCGSEETTRLSTTQGADEPGDCSDKVVDASGGSSSLRGGRTDDR